MVLTIIEAETLLMWGNWEPPKFWVLTQPCHSLISCWFFLGIISVFNIQFSYWLFFECINYFSFDKTYKCDLICSFAVFYTSPTTYFNLLFFSNISPNFLNSLVLKYKFMFKFLNIINTCFYNITLTKILYFKYFCQIYLQIEKRKITLQ